MKIDDRLSTLPLTKDQYFFASCWHNMVHAFSLDSYRVRAINPGNGLRELLRMLAPPANFDDFAVVALELEELLQNDLVLQSQPFIAPAKELLALLANIKDKDKDKSKSKFEKNKNLLQSFARELLRMVQSGYIFEILQKHLQHILIAECDKPSTEERNKLIYILTGNLLSTLLDRGASVESLFQLYRQVISNTKYNKAYVFAKRFSLLVKLITQQPRKYSVVFTVDNVSDINTFPPQIWSVRFSGNPPAITSEKPAIKRYINPSPNRLFAQIEVETSDYRSAGTYAYEQINDILDLVRFEYEREKLELSQEFVISDGEPLNIYRIFPIPKVVPNPAPFVDTNGLRSFIQSVNELMINPEFQVEGRSRVQSAFRLYRIGADAHIFENKLINWWSALEYLIKGSNSAGSIGKTVEDTLIPVLCQGYVNKLLISFRNAIVDVKANLTDASGQAIQLRELNPAEIYRLFKNPLQHKQLLDAATDPYMRQKLSNFLDALSTPKKIEELLKGHEQRLRWHVQRIYRARCDIVHSAERIVSAALLCANLEFYLKTTLTALLQMLRTVPHISGPKEFFDRQLYAYSRLLDDLASGHEERLLAQLQE